MFNDFFDMQNANDSSENNGSFVGFILSIFNGSDDSLIDQHAGIDTVTFSNTEID